MVYAQRTGITGGLQQALGAQDIGAEKDLGVQHCPAVVRFRRKVDDRVRSVLVEQKAQQLVIPDIAPDERVAISVLFRYICQIFQVPCVCEQVVMDHTVAWIAVQPSSG